MKWRGNNVTRVAFTVDTSYTVTGLIANATYFVTVTAVSFESNEFSVTTTSFESNEFSVTTTSCTRKY